MFKECSILAKQPCTSTETTVSDELSRPINTIPTDKQCMKQHIVQHYITSDYVAVNIHNYEATKRLSLHTPVSNAPDNFLKEFNLPIEFLMSRTGCLSS
jgi:hypothetical protein